MGTMYVGGNESRGSKGGLGSLSSSGKGQWFQISLHWNVSVSHVTY